MFILDTVMLLLFILLCAFVFAYDSYKTALYNLYLLEHKLQFPHRIEELEKMHRTVTTKLDFYVSQLNARKTDSNMFYIWDKELDIAVERHTENRIEDINNCIEDTKKEQNNIAKQIALCSDFFKSTTQQV